MIQSAWFGGRVPILLIAGWLTCVGLAGLFIMPVRAVDVPAWDLVWADEFNQADGTAPDSRSWAYDVGGGGWGNLELQSYTTRRENSRIEHGCLVIEARREQYTGSDNLTRQYTSARLKTEGRHSWTYGRLEARIQLTTSQGIWPAFWMLGSSISTVGWPGCGEIDIMENIGREPSRIHCAIHGPGYSGGNNIGRVYDLPGGGQLADAFHLFAVEWEPSVIRWYLDNRLFFTATPRQLPTGTTWVFNGQPFFLIVNLAVGGRFPGNPNASTVLPQSLQVDYIRVYRRTQASAAAVRIATGPDGVEAFWPSAFPNARLQQAVQPDAPWREVLTAGIRRGNEFVAPVSPGIHRLTWNP